MTLRREDLDRAVEDGVVTREQAEALWARTGEHRLAAEPAVGPLRVALALATGAVAAAILGAVLLDAWERAGPAGGLTVALLEGAALTIAARALALRAPRALHAAVLAALAVPLAPAAVRAAQAWTGALGPAGAPPTTLSAWLGGPAFLPAAAAVAAAVTALWAVGHPLLSAVLFGALWGSAMTAAPVVFGPTPTWAQHALLSALLGAAALAAGVALDGRLRRDHSGWIYLAGLAAFCGGVTTLHGDTGPSLAAALAAYAALVLASLALRRRAFAVFGALGVASGLARLADTLLAEAVVPYALVAIAAAVGAAALVHARVAPAWARAVAAALPAPLRRMLPPGAR